MYCSNCGKDIGEQPAFCQFCGIRVTPLAPYAAQMPQRRFVRFRSDKKIAGVCGGFARFFDLNATLVRVIWLLCVLLAGTGLAAYIVLWFIMPLEPEYPMLSA